MEWKYFKRNNWRKNFQWFALNRAHAEVLVNDTYFKNLFRSHCNGSYRYRFCPSDEHYIPSALDAYGLGGQVLHVFSKFDTKPSIFVVDRLTALECLLMSGLLAAHIPSLSSPLLSDQVFFWSKSALQECEQWRMCL